MLCTVTALLFAGAHAGISLDGMYTTADCSGTASTGGGSEDTPSCTAVEDTGTATYYLKADCTDAGEWTLSYHGTSDCSDVATETCASAMGSALTSATLPDYNGLNCYVSGGSDGCGVFFDLTDATISVAGINMTMNLGAISMAASCSSSSDPCFSATASFACLLGDAAVSPSTAYDHCFGNGGSMAERVPMSQLKAGDPILSSPVRPPPPNPRVLPLPRLPPPPPSPLAHSFARSLAQTEATRVIVNQHAAVSAYAPMVEVVHEHGTLALTPDHVLLVDGAFKPAREVHVGSTLSSSSVVTHVSRAAHKIISPVTTDGRILAAGPTGAPVLATVWPEWVAPLLLANPLPYPLPLSLSAAASYVFPATVQTYYDQVLEPLFTRATASLKEAKHALPAPAALGLILAVDVLVVAGLGLWAAAGLKGVATLLAVAAIAKSRRATRKA